MADPKTYSLIGEDGMKYTFPIGFDPIQAARIAKEHAQKDPSELKKFVNWAVEPTSVGIAAQTKAGELANSIDTAARTPVHAGLLDTIKDAPGIISDIASGLVHHPVATLRGGAAGVTQGVGDVLAAQSSPAALTATLAGPAASQVSKVSPVLGSLVRSFGTGASGVLGAHGVDEAVNAPDAEGKIMGGVQALLGAHGVVSDPAVVAGARKAAVPTGRLLVKGADSAAVRNTLRAGSVGAAGGAAASGHPFAAAGVLPIALAPEVMRYAGNKLIEAGQGTSGVVPVAAAVKGREVGMPDRTRTPYQSPIGETAQEAAARLSEAAKTERPTSTGVPEDQSAGAAQFLADLRKMSPEDRRAELARRTAAKPARDAAVAQDLPTTGRMEDILTTPKTARDVMAEKGIPMPEPHDYNARGTVANEQDIRQGATGDNWNKGRMSTDKSAALPTELADQIGAGPDNPDWFKQNDPQGFEAQLAKLEAESGLGKVQDLTMEGSGPTDAGMGGPKPGPEVGSLPLKQLTGEVDNGLPAEAQVEGSGPTDNNPAPGPNAGGDLGIEPQTFEEAIAAAMKPGLGKPAEAAPEAPPIDLTEPTVVPDNDPRVAAAVPPDAMAAPLPSRETVAPEGPKLNDRGRVDAGDRSFHSKSRRSKSQMSATPGYSKRDLSDVGLNPSLKYKDFDPTVHAQILANRASRASKYYGDALNAKAQAEAGM